jgi:hypothetical protein
LKLDVPELMRHRPFQIAWIWEVACLLAGLYGDLVLGYGWAFFAAVVIGAAPMAVVILRFAAAKKQATMPPRSRDIVQ